MSTRQRVLAAYHEAGHTVVAEERHGQNLRISIKRTATRWGFASQHLRALGIDDSVRVSLGGPTAEWFYSGKWDWSGAAHDHAEVVEWHAQMRERVGAAEAQRELNFYADATATVIAERWAAVDALARALLKNESLAHRQVTKIIVGTAGRVKPAPRRWSKRTRDAKLFRLLLHADEYRQVAADAGLDEVVQLGLVHLRGMTPKLWARKNAIMAELRAFLKSTGRGTPGIPRTLRRKLDAANAAINAAQQAAK